MKHRYIVVEGPIGSGKSTLSRLLAKHYGAELVLEDAGANPFLPLFYRDMRRYALSTQMFFLFHRVNQLSALRQPDLFERRHVADYMLEKDALFARLTLDDNEYNLYAQLYNHLKPQAPTPDLVIYLQAPIETLMWRIARRAEPMEKGISEDYLLKLSESYTRFFYEYHDAPQLIVNSEHMNFIEQPEHFEALLQRIGTMRGNREYFNRAG